MAWTGITAAALFTAAIAGGHRVGRFVAAFVLAVVLHGLWDSQTSLVGMAVVAVVSLAALAWTVHRVHAAAPADGRRPADRRSP
jgi:protease PrsW